MKNRTAITVLLVVLYSCSDLYVHRNKVFGPYYVESDPAKSCKTLYYETTNGLDFERIRCIEKAGQAKGFIIVKTTNAYQFLNIKNDKPSDLGHPDVKKNISKKLSQSEFENFMDSLNIKDFEFTYEK